MIAAVGRIAAPGLAKTDVAAQTPHGAALESTPGPRRAPTGSSLAPPPPFRRGPAITELLDPRRFAPRLRSA